MKYKNEKPQKGETDMKAYNVTENRMMCCCCMMCKNTEFLRTHFHI